MTARSGAAIAMVAAIAAGCVASNTVPCGDSVCPPGSTCTDGVCVGPGDACGNRHVDLALEEVCDDGNQLDGDGCSADCRSTETCGNDRVDSLAMVPEACECHAGDCTVETEVCTDYGADFGLLTCGAPDSPDACQLAFGACETFGWRQRASADALRIRVHASGVVALDRLGQLAIYATDMPQPVPAIAAGVAIVDFALVGDALYAAATDRKVYRLALGATAWEPALFQLPTLPTQIEGLAVDASTIDLVMRWSSGVIAAVRGTGATWGQRGNPTAFSAALGGSTSGLFMFRADQLYRLDPVAAPDPWVPVPVVLPVGETIVDAAAIAGVTWIITSEARVLRVGAGGGVVGGRPLFFPTETALRFVAGAGVTVASDKAVAEWNGSAWHLIDPALFAPIRGGDAAGGLQVVADARGLQVRQPRAWQSASAGAILILDATTGPDPTTGFDRLYVATGLVAAIYDGVQITLLDDGGLVPLAPQPAPVQFVRSVCGFVTGDYAVASVDQLAACTPTGCQPLVAGPNGTIQRLRCTRGPTWAWVIYTDAANRAGVIRFDAGTGTLAAAAVITNAEEVNSIATITSTAVPASSISVAVGRDAGAGAVWTITGPDTVVAEPRPELADLLAVHACGNGEWLAGGLSVAGRAAVIHHRLGGEDLIELPLAQPVVELAGTCTGFYAATRTDLVYVAGGVVTPVRWPFLESFVAMSADDRGNADPRDDVLLVGARGSVRALR